MPDLTVAAPFANPQLVLVADDDEASRQTYRDYLSARGIRVDEASDGPEALAKSISRRPDVVVTETELPGFSGYDLCSLLRRDVATNCTPIIFVTAETLPTVRDRAHDAGADVVLAKPCLPQLLLVEIRRLIQRSRELREHGAALRERIAAQLEKSQRLRTQIRLQRRRSLSKILDRHETMTPPLPPPELVCPTCDRLLLYQKSHLGGVSERHTEQWDDFVCPWGCGTFKYRQRTRKLRKT